MDRTMEPAARRFLELIDEGVAKTAARRDISAREAFPGNSLSDMLHRAAYRTTKFVTKPIFNGLDMLNSAGISYADGRPWKALGQAVGGAAQIYSPFMGAGMAAGALRYGAGVLGRAAANRAANKALAARAALPRPPMPPPKPSVPPVAPKPPFPSQAAPAIAPKPAPGAIGILAGDARALASKLGPRKTLERIRTNPAGAAWSTVANAGRGVSFGLGDPRVLGPGSDVAVNRAYIRRTPNGSLYNTSIRRISR